MAGGWSHPFSPSMCAGSSSYVRVQVGNPHQYAKLSQTTFARSGWSVEKLFGSYIDVLRELEAETYTIRIAASRYFRIFVLEGPIVGLSACLSVSVCLGMSVAGSLC